MTPLRVRNAQMFNRRFAVVATALSLLGMGGVALAASLGPVALLVSLVPGGVALVAPFVLWRKRLAENQRILQAWALLQQQDEARKLEKELQLLRLTG